MIKIEFFSLYGNIYRNQLEVDPLKNLFFLAVLKIDVKDSFGYNKEIEMMEKKLPYNINLLYVNIAKHVFY